MFHQVDDCKISVVVGVGKVNGEATRRFEPLYAGYIAVARQQSDARVPPLVPEPREVGMGMLRLKGHGKVGDDDEGLREGHVMDEWNVRQVNPRLGGGTPVAVDGDISNRLGRFICQHVLFTRGRIELGMAGEARLKGAAEVGPPDTLQFVVKVRPVYCPPRLQRTTFHRRSGIWPITSKSMAVTSLLRGAKFLAT